MIRILSIIAALFYLMVTVGVAVNLHYCSGNLQSVDISYSSDGCCCADSDASEITCCSNDFLFVQLDTEQQPPHSPAIPGNDIEPVAFSLLPGPPSFEINHSIPVEANPPPNIPLFLLNCSFTFYG